MADSMFNTNGSLTSTDPNVINAAMRATGGQILPSSPAFKRALELAQLRNVQMQQGMAEGGQAVKNLQAYQAANPPTISGLPSNQVVTSDTGYKAVLDAQGNIVGTSAPTAPVSKFGDERAAFNQGQGTMLEKAALGPNIRDAFLKEYAKPKPVQAVAVGEIAKSVPRSELPAVAASLAASPAASPMMGALMALQQASPPIPVNALASAPASPALPYVPYGDGENYVPKDETGKALSVEQQVSQLLSATPSEGERESMFKATEMRKSEMEKRKKLDAALKSGDRDAAKKLSDEINALRSKYLFERKRGGFERGASNLEGLST